MDVHLITLGSPKVFLGEEQVPSLPGKPVSFGLLVYLALEKESSRDRLTSVFWAESTEERARGALSQTLYELRKELQGEWVETSGNMVRTTAHLSVDASRFGALVEEERFEEAVSLYSAPFLSGIHLAKTRAFEEWVERQRGRLGRMNRVATDGFIKASRGRGDLEAALRTAAHWVDMDPLEDGAQHHLIRLLAESGRRNEALAQFSRYETLLEAELGLQPMDETASLVKAIREGTLDPPALGLRASGDAGEAVAVPVTWPAPLPGTRSHSDLVGRAKDRDELLRSLEEELDPDLQILRPIGHGSMAGVFLAREPALKRLVAIKALSPERFSDERARSRFVLEAQSAARLNHQNVCSVYRVGSLSDGTPYLVMPFVKGSSLAQRVKAEGRLGIDEARQVLHDVACGLAAAHKAGVVHRDVRPDNVLFEEETGRYYLCDFGIAAVLDATEDTGPGLTKTGEILGDPAFISPEQMEGQAVTDRTDVYSLGIMVHQILTGHTPSHHRAGSGRKSGEAVNLEPLSGYIGEKDPELVDIVRRCLDRDPASRPNAAAVVRRLEKAAGPSPPMAPPIPGPPGRFFAKLIERRFFQIIGGYLAASWIALEAASELEARELLPEPSFLLALSTAVFGFLAVNVLAWFHGQKGRQAWPATERWMLGAVGVGWVLACLAVLS